MSRLNKYKLKIEIVTEAGSRVVDKIDVHPETSNSSTNWFIEWYGGRCFFSTKASVKRFFERKGYKVKEL